MKITQRVKNAVAAFNGQQSEPVKNSANSVSDFLRFGNKNSKIYQDWSEPEMTDRDFYSGYGYGVVNKRANRSRILGKNFLYTKASDIMTQQAKASGKELEHPYLPLISGSKEFTEGDFWWEISRYLDLEGVYYLMAVRAVGQDRKGDPKVGETQKFVMLNPYEVKKVYKKSTHEFGGYVEARDGMYREIPKEMIIEIIYRDPIKREEPYALADAAKDAQFTLKQAGDYTRHSIQGNVNSPGAITTAVELEDHLFDNFIARIQNHTKGEPLYGNGAGAINWESMQIDLDKAALDKINEIHRSMLFAVSGTSKTMMGIEESGTGREVSKTQKDDFTENAIMPQVEKIIDSLNLDYRKWYPEWDENKYEIALDNPLESDRDAEVKDIEIRDKELDLRDKLVGQGYEYEIASRYAHGELTLEELGEPTLEPELTDEEADLLAAKELGIELPKTEDDDPTANNSVVSKVSNKFVKPEENQQKVSAAKDRLKSGTAKKKTKKEQSEDIQDDEDDKKKADKDASKDSKKVVKKEEDKDKDKEKNELAVNQISSRDIPDLYDDIDIDVENLGCIMINTEKIPVLQYIKDGEKDLVEATDRHDHTMGAVSEVEPHATLLYGLLENGNKWKNKVDKLLEGWELPVVKIEKVDYFDLPESYAVIAKLEKTDELVDGHERLTLLPHINTFSEYSPHITLAYINKEADINKWVEILGKKYNSQIVATTSINYGDEPEDKTDNHIDDEHAPPKKGKKPAVVKKNETKTDSNASNSSVEACVSHVCHEHDHLDYSNVERAQNALQTADKDTVMLNQGSLQNGILDIDQQMVNEILLKIQNGTWDEEMGLTKTESNTFVNKLATLLAAYYLVVMPIYGKQSIANRSDEFGQQGFFAMTQELRNYISNSSKMAADSHFNTILSDIQKAANKSILNATNLELEKYLQERLQLKDPDYLKMFKDNPSLKDIKKAIQKGTFDSDPAYALARERAMKGESLEQIVRAIKNEYANISDNRAKTIARHESSRAFTMSQYQADLQFLKETNMLSKAYKRLVSRSGNPCAVCASLISKSQNEPVPFTNNFADLNTELSASYEKENGKMAVQKVVVNYEPITSGNVHVNCNCEYELVIKKDDGTWTNSFSPDLAIIDTKE